MACFTLFDYHFAVENKYISHAINHVHKLFLCCEELSLCYPFFFMTRTLQVNPPKMSVSAKMTLYSLVRCAAEIKEQSAEEDAEVEADGSKRLAPALQRSVSEESASSLVSVGVEAKIRLEDECSWLEMSSRRVQLRM